MGMADPVHKMSFSSTTIIIQRTVINSSRVSTSRVSERGATPLISTLEITQVNKALNGTFSITCIELGTLVPVETTTVDIAGNYHA